MFNALSIVGTHNGVSDSPNLQSRLFPTPVLFSLVVMFTAPNLGLLQSFVLFVHMPGFSLVNLPSEFLVGHKNTHVRF